LAGGWFMFDHVGIFDLTTEIGNGSLFYYGALA
jgi:hypothetical protein